MIPYLGPSSAGLLAIPLLPTLLLRARGRLPSWWVLACTLLVLLLQRDSQAPAWPLVEMALVSAWWYGLARLFLRLRTTHDSRLTPWLVVAGTLAPWLVVKSAVLGGGGWPQDLAILGLSYVTLRAVDVVLSIQDRLVKALPLGDYLAYLWFFPTLLAGPIDRYRRFQGDLHRSRPPAELRADLDEAASRVATGLLYKFVVATLIQRHWMEPAAASTSLGSTISYMYAYTLYLFFDFAAYSAFAIGVSRILGIRTPENFASPFAASNIREFWNRWHISLSSFLRDHVYMRIVMAATRGRWFRRSEIAGQVAIVASFTLMGLWHGFTWRYLAYGLFHAGVMLAFDALNRWNKERRVWGQGWPWKVAGAIITAHVFAVSMLLFSGRLEQVWWNQRLE